MMQTYTYPQYDYRQSEEQISGPVIRHPVVIIGAGTIGMTQS